MLTVACVGCAGAAYTKSAERPKVVVLGVKGSNGAARRGDIVDVLKQSDYPLVPRAEYVKTARRLKAKKLRARHISKVSTELGLSAVISGKVKRRGKRRYLYVTVHDGPSGARVERFRVRLTRKRALTEKGARQLQDKLMAALSELKPVSPERDRADAESVVAESEPRDKKKAKKKQAKKEPGADAPKRETRAERRRREKREARERARAEKQREREDKARKKREAQEAAEKERQRKIAERKRKEREERERAERERKKREAAKREAALIKKVTKPKTRDDGQAIDDESPF